MSREMISALLRRWARVFVGAGVAQVAALLLVTNVESVISDPVKAGYGLLVAFLAGGAAALDKRLRWKE